MRSPDKVRDELDAGGHRYYAHQLGKVRAGEQVHPSTLAALRRRDLVTTDGDLTRSGLAVLTDAQAAVDREDARG